MNGRELAAALLALEDPDLPVLVETDLGCFKLRMLQRNRPRERAHRRPAGRRRRDLLR